MREHLKSHEGVMMMDESTVSTSILLMRVY